MLPTLSRRFLLVLIFLLPGAFASAHTAVAQSTNGISAPASRETISGVVVVTGTAVHPDYLRYELAFWQEFNPGAGWIVFAEGSEQVIEDTLAIWDTTIGRDIGAPVFPDGRYQLRLRVVKTDYNYDEYYVTDLIISNDEPTPTPTPDEAATVTAESAAQPQPAGVDTNSFQQPTPLPSLTPFPTPTPQATPVNERDSGIVAANTENGGGLLGELSAIETGRFRDAFWRGVTITGYLFGALGIYLLFRAILRRLWRYLWVKISN